MTAEEESPLDGCFALLLWAFFSFPISFLAPAFTIMMFWSWFVVPLGAPVIGIWHAIGIRFLVIVLTKVVSDKELKKLFEPRTRDEKLDSNDRPKRRFLFSVVFYGFTLAVGWVAMKLMTGAWP